MTSIRYDETSATLQGWVGVEEAEALAAWLTQAPGRGVHLAGCTQLHAAVLQVLLALRPALLAPPPEPRLAAALAPLQGRA